MENNLQRFTDAQKTNYETALTEIKNGRKQSHWMWFIFPQVAGLGFSETSRYYAIKNLHEATAYLNHPILGPRLIAICNELLKLNDNNATRIFGNPDDLKLKSSMTLFASVPDTYPVFGLVLEKFFGGKQDAKTLQLINHVS